MSGLQYTFEPLEVLTGEGALEEAARTVLRYSAGPVEPSTARLVCRPHPAAGPWECPAHFHHYQPRLDYEQRLMRPVLPQLLPNLKHPPHPSQEACSVWLPSAGRLLCLEAAGADRLLLTRQAAAKAESEREAEARRQAAEAGEEGCVPGSEASAATPPQLPPVKALRNGAADLKALLAAARTAGVPAAVLWTEAPPPAQAPAQPATADRSSPAAPPSDEGLAGARASPAAADSCGSAGSSSRTGLDGRALLQGALTRLLGGEGGPAAHPPQLLTAHFDGAATKSNR